MEARAGYTGILNVDFFFLLLWTIAKTVDTQVVGCDDPKILTILSLLVEYEPGLDIRP